MNSEIPDELFVRVVAPSGILAEERGVSAVRIPSVNGELGILPGHRSLIAALGSGQLIIEKGTSREEFQIHGGTAEIRPNRVIIFTSEGKDPSIPD